MKRPTQRRRADAIRASYREHFKALADLQEKLGHVLDDAQNGPPDGGSDGTISETQFNQLRSIQKATKTLLATLLFDSP